MGGWTKPGGRHKTCLLSSQPRGARGTRVSGRRVRHQGPVHRASYARPRSAPGSSVTRVFFSESHRAASTRSTRRRHGRRPGRRGSGRQGHSFAPCQPVVLYEPAGPRSHEWPVRSQHTILTRTRTTKPRNIPVPGPIRLSLTLLAPRPRLPRGHSARQPANSILRYFSSTTSNCRLWSFIRRASRQPTNKIPTETPN